MIVMEKVNDENKTKKMTGEGVEFERFNNGKKAEEHDRVKHTYDKCSCTN